MDKKTDEITVADAARILGVPTAWVNRAITKGEIVPTNLNDIPSVFKRPRAWKLSRSAILAYKEKADKERATKKHPNASSDDAPMVAVAG